MYTGLHKKRFNLQTRLWSNNDKTKIRIKSVPFVIFWIFSKIIDHRIKKILLPRKISKCVEAVNLHSLLICNKLYRILIPQKQMYDVFKYTFLT